MHPALEPLLFQPRFPNSLIVNPTTDSGYVSYQNGSRLFLPAATNYCTNPSFETDTNADGRADGWSYWASGLAGTPTSTLVAGITGGGGYAQRSQYTGMVGDVGAYYSLDTDLSGVGTFAPGDIVTLSFSVLGAVSGATLKPLIYWRKADGSGAGSSYGSVITFTASAQRVSVTATAPANTSQVRCGIETHSTLVDNGDTIDITIDDVLIEKSSILTPYGDGSYPGWAWTGTAHASTSVRTASDFVMPFTFGTTAMTVAARITPLFPAGAYHPLMSFVSGAAPYVYTNGNRDYMDWSNSVDPSIAESASYVTKYIVGRGIQGVTADLNVNGTNATQEDASANTPHALTGLRLGNSRWDTTASPLYIGPVILSPTRKSDGWVAQIQQNSGIAYKNLRLLYRDYMSAGDLILPLEGDSRGYLKMSGSGRIT